MRLFRCFAAFYIAAAMLVGGGALVVYHASAEERKQHSNPWLLTWIPARCCVTSDCCYEIKSGAVEPLPEDKWKIKASGQIVPRTDWSPDGRYYRCACGWKSNVETDHTYCIFVPLNATLLLPK